MPLTWIVPESKLDKLGRVFQSMRPLIEKSHFEKARIDVKNKEDVGVCAQLLEGSSVKLIEIHFRRNGNGNSIDTAHLLDMISRAKPMSMRFTVFQLTKRTFFLCLNI